VDLHIYNQFTDPPPEHAEDDAARAEEDAA